MKIHLFKFLASVVPRLPVGVSYWLAAFAGDLVWFFARRVRANFEHNQKRALGPGASPDEIAASGRAAIRNLAKIYVDEFRLPALSVDEIKSSINIQGLEHLEAAHAKGKGIILATAHFGAPHFVSQLLAVLDYPTTVVAEHIQPEALYQFMCQLRQSHGLRLIPVDGPMIGLIRTLRKEKGIVGLVVDRDVTKSGICLPFLGEQTRVADGPVQLAVRTGAPIVVAYCRRLPDNRYEAFVEPALEMPQVRENAEDAVRAGTAQLMARVEAFIREEPGQWVMSVPLWKENCRDGEEA